MSRPEVPDTAARRFGSAAHEAAEAFARRLVNEDADIREGMRADRDAEPWCPEHGYGCEQQNCPCGHSLGCMCWSDKDG